mmetsp:Transcript_15551/g.32185  ORF Transcript_15551/g.32185 Transcript_15551/m.32185 type:complete len:176 (+) Transcript_15551:75-602(+)|eukprot:CAMPEP_0197275930 /NCGR_PEP_ID=MMETSP1432-20130617/14581_1 /TAXON_ID=44447 /ORGANISM="Pseudo-nitzschia delicatissima, Strain UNC1205" /LENGTH=175 /DNA_ID=CAMNT_0042741891 /DNA_START=9 /DNA_END=536 /DNA_ORIENTATION=+
MKVGTFTIIAATLPALASSFLVAPQTTSSTSLMAKGFGAADEAPKEKSAAQIKRENASSKYDEIAKTGGQEYSIFVRQFGGADESWLPCGSIAVARGDQVSNAIFSNEEPLKLAIGRTFPKLVGFEAEFEYGYNLKIYPDEPVEVAVKNAAGSGPSVGNWLSNLLSPIDASDVKN